MHCIHLQNVHSVLLLECLNGRSDVLKLPGYKMSFVSLYNVQLVVDLEGVYPISNDL